MADADGVGFEQVYLIYQFRPDIVTMKFDNVKPLYLIAAR